MIGDILLALALVALYVLLVLVSPVQRCSWCRGTLRVKKHRLWGRVGKCPKCKGERKHARFGAPLIHRLRQAVLADLRERREAKR